MFVSPADALVWACQVYGIDQAFSLMDKGGLFPSRTLRQSSYSAKRFAAYPA